MIYGDRGGQGVGPSLPIHLFGNVASKIQMLQMLQQTHDIKFWKITLSNGKKKYVFHVVFL